MHFFSIARSFVGSFGVVFFRLLCVSAAIAQNCVYIYAFCCLLFHSARLALAVLCELLYVFGLSALNSNSSMSHL